MFLLDKKHGYVMPCWGRSIFLRSRSRRSLKKDKNPFLSDLAEDSGIRLVSPFCLFSNEWIFNIKRTSNVYYQIKQTTLNNKGQGHQGHEKNEKITTCQYLTVNAINWICIDFRATFESKHCMVKIKNIVYCLNT